MSTKPTRITPEMVEEWRRIEQAATEGPWRRGWPSFSCKKHRPPHPGPPDCVYTFDCWRDSDNDISADNIQAGNSDLKQELIAGMWDYEEGGVKRKEDADFIVAARTAIPLLIADWEQQREEIRQHSEEMVVAHMLRRELEAEIEKLTPPEVPGHTLTVSIEAMAPGATHSVCGKGKTVAEAVASLREMVAKKEA